MRIKELTICFIIVLMAMHSAFAQHRTALNNTNILPSVCSTNNTDQLFSITPTTAAFGPEGGTQTFTVSTSTTWNVITYTDLWAHLTKNGNTLTLKVDPNTETGSRVDYFDISDGQKTIRVHFSQRRGAFLILSTNNLNVSHYGSNKTITVNANHSWDIETNANSWIHPNINGEQLSVNIDENKNTYSRTGYFTIKSDTVVKRVDISQDAAPIPSYLTVNNSSSNQTKYLSGSSHREYFSVSTSASSYEIVGLPYWCKIENKTSNGFTLVCESNPSTSTRNDYFTVRAAGKEIRINLTQYGRPSGQASYSYSKSKNDRFPAEVEWQNIIGFNAGSVGRYFSPNAVFEGTKSLFSGNGTQASGKNSFAWDVNYIGGALFCKTFFMGIGTGVSGYRNYKTHKRDVTIPLFIHLKWNMTGNSLVSPYLAVSEGIDFYICQDYAQKNFMAALHTRFDIGVHFKPDKYSKFGIAIGYQFGFAPYRITEETRHSHKYIYRYSYYSGVTDIHTISLQSLYSYCFRFATLSGGYISMSF